MMRIVECIAGDPYLLTTWPRSSPGKLLKKTETTSESRAEERQETRDQAIFEELTFPVTPFNHFRLYSYDGGTASHISKPYNIQDEDGIGGAGH
jgi:hypothetical protein